MDFASKYSKVVGGDINELAPIKGFPSYNFLAAKLAYKILSYKFINFKLKDQKIRSAPSYCDQSTSFF